MNGVSLLTKGTGDGRQTSKDDSGLDCIRETGQKKGRRDGEGTQRSFASRLIAESNVLDQENYDRTRAEEGRCRKGAQKTEKSFLCHTRQVKVFPERVN